MRTNEQILDRMAEDLMLRGLATRTQQTYLTCSRLFLNWGGCPAETMDEENIRAYLNHLITKKELSASTVNIYSSALRFLFAITLGRNLNYRKIPRLKQGRKLPEILTRSEIVRIFNHASTLRNKAVLMTVYGAGLRLSEVCKLKVGDIDSESMCIFVCGKGNKDRYTLLSQTNLEVLREYWKSYNPVHPDGWLFLNADGSKQVHWRTIETAFSSAAQHAGISKKVSLHTLRHCFATHLLEDGADIYRIKQLLGHSSIQSTTVYLHLQTNFISELVSPLDTISKNAGKQAEGGGC